MTEEQVKAAIKAGVTPADVVEGALARDRHAPLELEDGDPQFVVFKDRWYICGEAGGDTEEFVGQEMTAATAAEKYVVAGGYANCDDDYDDDYDDESTMSTLWIDVEAWRRGIYANADGTPREGRVQVEYHTVALNPDEPPCLDEQSHNWSDDEDLAGHVHSSGGGVVYSEVCTACGWERETDTWAQRPDTGEQGLQSETYIPRRKSGLLDSWLKRQEI